jgi:CDP-2,3-bis-(O-geranylgeranyl)-sn-glycerol synthase
MTDLSSLVISSFAIILPAYIANSVPLLIRGKHPVDFGKNFVDGKRLLGDGKTYEGLFGGLIIGTLTGVPFGYTFFTFLLAAGALLGDMAGAFIKRRMGIERGRPAPFLDQLDFVAGALLLLSPFYAITAEQVVFIVIVTPPIHLFTNFLAYKLKLKSNPW